MQVLSRLGRVGDEDKLPLLRPTSLYLFVSTKAIHLELVTNLTTENFLAALHRFTGRRSICSRIFSDNGTNFVGAARELGELYDFLKREKGNYIHAVS